MCIYQLIRNFYCKKLVYVICSNSPRINSILQTGPKTHQGHFLGWTFSVLLDLTLWNVLAICEAVNRWASCGSRMCHGYWTTAFLLITAEHIGALWSTWLKKEKIDMPNLCTNSLDWYVERIIHENMPSHWSYLKSAIVVLFMFYFFFFFFNFMFLKC